MKSLFTFIILIFSIMPATAQPVENYMLVGTYTSSGVSKGINVYKFNSETGEVKSIGIAATSNPTFLDVSPDEKFVYAVHEIDRSGKGGEIDAFSFDKKTGTLSFMNREATGGDHPCYVQVDKTGQWVFAGNYSSGSLSVFPVQNSGGLNKVSEFIQHHGSGANKERQDRPHVHCTLISPDNKWLYVPDLGIDKVMIYSFDEKTGKLKEGEQAFSQSRPGSGPRHFTFHPNGKFAYLIEELSGHVVAFHYKDGQLEEIQRISTTKDAATGYPGSADIHVSPDGKFLYATNRGDFNTIATYSVDTAKGVLTAINNQSVLGKAPRNFSIDPSGKFLFVANQDSNEIVIFDRNTETGLLSDTGKRIKVGMPVCIKWISAE